MNDMHSTDPLSDMSCARKFWETIRHRLAGEFSMKDQGAPKRLASRDRRQRPVTTRRRLKCSAVKYTSDCSHWRNFLECVPAAHYTKHWPSAGKFLIHYSFNMRRNCPPRHQYSSPCARHPEIYPTRGPGTTPPGRINLEDGIRPFRAYMGVEEDEGQRRVPHGMRMRQRCRDIPMTLPLQFRYGLQYRVL